jgi:hypothetical protein
MNTTNIYFLFYFILCDPGADPGFQVGGGALKKIVFRVKNHEKNHIFSNFRGGARRVPISLRYK